LASIPIQLTAHDDCRLDWIIICIKAYHYENAIPRIKRLINPNTKIAVFRNGLNLTSDFIGFSDRKNILETIIDCPTQKNGQAGYIQFNKPQITIPRSSLALDFINLFGTSEIEINPKKKFKKLQWEKLIESSSLGAIQAFTGQPCSVFKDKNVLVEYTKLITEAINVAQSEGIKIKNNFTDSLLNKIKTYPPAKGSTMLTDKLAGNKLELEAKIGAILKTGLNNNIKTPTTQRIYNSLLT